MPETEAAAAVADAEAVRVELAQLKAGALRQRAETAGADRGRVEATIDDLDKAAVVELIVEAMAAGAAGGLPEGVPVALPEPEPESSGADSPAARSKQPRSLTSEGHGHDDVSEAIEEVDAPPAAPGGSGAAQQRWARAGRQVTGSLEAVRAMLGQSFEDFAAQAAARRLQAGPPKTTSALVSVDTEGGVACGVLFVP
eukprot:COSAG06_NODE_24517_length_660_cov_1.042781_1_plen_197_part_01